MDILELKTGDAVIILGNEPTRAEIIEILVNEPTRAEGRRVIQVNMRASEYNVNGANENISIRVEEQILKRILEHDTALTFAAELQRSRDQHFGRLFGKWLKENDVEGQIRRAAKQGYLGITFDLKNHDDEYKQLLTDTRFEPTIKRKFGEDFYIKRDTDPIYFGNMQIGRHNKVILRWGK